MRPTVFLVKLGPVSHHTARAAYSKNFFEAGGFEAVNEGASLTAASRGTGIGYAPREGGSRLDRKAASLSGAASLVMERTPGETTPPLKIVRHRRYGN